MHWLDQILSYYPIQGFPPFPSLTLFGALINASIQSLYSPYPCAFHASSPFTSHPTHTASWIIPWLPLAQVCQPPHGALVGGWLNAAQVHQPFSRVKTEICLIGNPHRYRWNTSTACHNNKGIFISWPYGFLMVSVRWLSQLNVESLHLFGSPPPPLIPRNLLFSLTATAADVEVKRMLERFKNWIRRETPLSACSWVIIRGQNFVRSRRLSAVIVRDTQKRFWFLDWHSGETWHWILQDGGFWVTVQTVFMTLTSEWLLGVIFFPVFLSTA